MPIRLSDQKFSWADNRIAEPRAKLRAGRAAQKATNPADRHRANPLDVPPLWEDDDIARPINWCALGPEEAEREWARLDAWVY